MIKNELKNKFFILLSRCVEGIFTSTLFTPLLTGFGGILLNTNLYFRYKHNFNVWNEFFFCIQRGCAWCNFWNVWLYIIFI